MSPRLLKKALCRRTDSVSAIKLLCLLVII